MVHMHRLVLVAVATAVLTGAAGAQEGDGRYRYCWRIQAQAGCNMSRTKADWRVRASGVPASQVPSRTKFIAAAVTTCCSWGLGQPDIARPAQSLRPNPGREGSFNASPPPVLLGKR